MFDTYEVLYEETAMCIPSGQQCARLALRLWSAHLSADLGHTRYIFKEARAQRTRAGMPPSMTVSNVYARENNTLKPLRTQKNKQKDFFRSASVTPLI